MDIDLQAGAPTGEAKADVPAPAPVSEPVSESVRVLVVDDDVPYRTLCRRYLRRDTDRAYEVTTAATGEEAVALAGNTRFDCVLVDYYLPDCTGTELIERLRGRLRLRMPPVVVISADGGEDAAIQSVRAHALDYLAKRDLTSASLCRSVGNAVEKGELRRSVRARRRQLRKANVALERRAVEIQRFYHTVSHEMKTPLTAAREFVAIVHDGLTGPIEDEARQMLGHALESCDQITRQFDDLLDLTRLETGKLRLALEAVPLEPVLARCLATIESVAAAKSIVVEQELDTSLPHVRMDSGRIGQVISNLLGNAVKFTPDGGRVRLLARDRGNARGVEIRVSDTGRGIDKVDRRQVFERLYQVGTDGHDPSSNGLGLGLSIAREILHGHDSELSLHSRIGVGSIFRFFLPRAHVASPGESTEAPKRTSS